jgi:4-amino-4-deoxy-L-arabinose transferase-like glycosyltransferase
VATNPAARRPERNWQLLVAGLLLLALGVRMAAALVIDQQVTAAGRKFLIEGDANGYWELGQKLASGGEYAIHSPPRRILRTPGFPLLLAVSIRIFGDSIFAASLLLAALGTVCCWLTWLFARGLFGRGVAVFTLLLTAISPLQVGSNVQILSETWFTFWVLLSLWTLRPFLPDLTSGDSSPLSPSSPESPAIENRPPPLWWAFRAGLVTGFGVLVRPGWILWPLLACGLLILSPRVPRRSRRLLMSGVVCLGCWGMLLPWALRNASVCGHMVYTSLWSGPSLYDGLNQHATGASDMRFLDQEALYSRFSEYEVNEQYKRRAWQFAIQNPERVFWLALAKMARYLSPGLQASGFSGGYFSLICWIWYGFFWTFVFTGVLRLRRHLFPLALLASPFLLFLLVHMVFVGSVRYRLPAEFPLSVIAAYGMASILHRWWGKQTDCHTINAGSMSPD